MRDAIANRREGRNRRCRGSGADRRRGAPCGPPPRPVHHARGVGTDRVKQQDGIDVRTVIEIVPALLAQRQRREAARPRARFERISRRPDRRIERFIGEGGQCPGNALQVECARQIAQRHRQRNAVPANAERLAQPALDRLESGPQRCVCTLCRGDRNDLAVPGYRAPQEGREALSAQAYLADFQHFSKIDGNTQASRHVS